jgi:hypothetical protein
MRNDPLTLLAVKMLTELSQRKSSGFFLSPTEKELGEVIIEVLPQSVTFFCLKCAERDVSCQAIEGFNLCRTHMLEQFRRKSPPFGVGPSRLLAPRTNTATQDEKVQFVGTLLAQKRMGKPISVTDKARAHLVADAHSFSQEELCVECVAEGYEWPACEGFSLCAEHLHEAIEAPPLMT